MRFWVAMLCGLCLSCGGSVTQKHAPGAGGSAPLASGGTPTTVSGGSGGGQGSGGMSAVHDGGSILLTPEQLDELTSSACVGWSSSGPEPFFPAIELVISAESSMSLPAPGINLSRWDVLKTAVEHSFENWGERSYIGLIAYPNLPGDGATPSPGPQDVGACLNLDAIVPLDLVGPVGSQQRATIEAAMEVVTLNAGRPLGDAYERAVDELVSGFGTKPFVVLIVDGPPTLLQQCINPTGTLTPVETGELVRQIEQAYVTYGVQTFVIGLPGSEGIREMLTLAASVGGTAPGCGPLDICHFDLSPTQDLASALDAAFVEIGSEIAASVAPPAVSCGFTIPPPPAGQTIDLEKVTVVIISPDGEARVILLDEIGECNEGFRFVSPEELELCPASCERLQDGVFELLFGCSPASP